MGEYLFAGIGVGDAVVPSINKESEAEIGEIPGW